MSFTIFFLVLKFFTPNHVRVSARCLYTHPRVPSATCLYSTFQPYFFILATRHRYASLFSANFVSQFHKLPATYS